MVANAISTARVVESEIWIADLVTANGPGIARGWGLVPGRPRMAAAKAPDMLPLSEAPDLPAAAQAANIMAEAEAVTIVAER